MRSILECESARLAEQPRLDRMKTARERNLLGQFATPPALSLEIAKYAWNKLRRRNERFSFLDPAVGTGSFYSAFRQAFPSERIELSTGVELDVAFSEAVSSIWKSQGLRLIHGDFTKQSPDAKYNVILTNPPYVRHHHLSVNDKRRLGDMAFKTTGLKPSGLTGLYCYFMLIAHDWLAENGLSVWLIPSEFMDVNYGSTIRKYLTEKVTLLHIHRYCPSRVQFDDALVSSAVVAFVKRKTPQGHRVKFTFGGSLASPAQSKDVSLDVLKKMNKWSGVNRINGNGRKKNGVVLGDLFAVKRGIATGNNAFFVVPRKRLRQLGIPLSCVKPILPSPRFLREEIIEQDDNGWPLMDEPLALIDCRLPEERIRRKWSRFWDYLDEGMQRNVHCGYLTSRRTPWYSQERRDPAPFMCTYMGRSREKPFRFIFNKSTAIAANVYLLLYPKPFIANAVKEQAEEVFDLLRSIRPQDFFNEGRVYGGGLHKMEPTELMRLPADNLADILDLDTQRQLAFF